MEKSPPEKNPNGIIIFIIGTSAVGKTKLSLSLAEQLTQCEIINCDSMQMYKTADIMTAKATKSEQQKIKHHLVDILDLSVKDFNRTNYLEIGIKTIESLFKEGIIPIVVGGTHYYIESLLFKDNEVLQEKNEEDLKGFEKINTLEDYNLLKKIDPMMAGKIHPNDKRKIRNYLNLYNKHKKIPSELIKSQEFNKSLRYENSIILWPFMENTENLREKARIRIDEMATKEGIKEIIAIYESFCGDIHDIDLLEKNLDFQRGVLQAIGYKEFFPFYKEIKKLMIKLNLNYKKFINNEKETDDFLEYINKNNDLQKILIECKERLLMKTMKYTKKQIVWIENRLLNFKILENKLFKFPFDDYNGDKFEKFVITPACAIMNSYKKDLDFYLLKNFNRFLAQKHGNSTGKRIALEEWKKHFCETCSIELNGPKEWEIHLKSKKHTKKKVKINKEKNEIENKMKNIENL